MIRLSENKLRELASMLNMGAMRGPDPRAQMANQRIPLLPANKQFDIRNITNRVTNAPEGDMARIIEYVMKNSGETVANRLSDLSLESNPKEYNDVLNYALRKIEFDRGSADEELAYLYNLIGRSSVPYEPPPARTRRAYQPPNKMRLDYENADSGDSGMEERLRRLGIR